MRQEPAIATTGTGGASVQSSDLRRDYATTFLTEVLVIASYLVAFRLVAVHLGQTGFGEYALSRRTLSLIAPLGVVGLDVAIARYVAYGLAQRSGRARGYAGAALLIMAVYRPGRPAPRLVFPGLFAGRVFRASGHPRPLPPPPGVALRSRPHPGVRRCPPAAGP